MTDIAYPVPNRKVKDTLFRKLFSEPESLLELYNAVNESHYTDPGELKITTLDNAIYMTMKNDVSFLISQEMNLYEHQSTVNKNMPLRGLFYFSTLYQNYINENKLDVYGSRRLDLPFPRYIVFYNGETELAEREELRLSDAFLPGVHLQEGIDSIQETKEPALECRATVLNINYGHNRKLMDACHQLRDYAQFIQIIRDCRREGLSYSAAVDRAIDECIARGILGEFLVRHREEARMRILEEYDPEFHMRKEKELSYEEGIAVGREEKMEENISALMRSLKCSREEAMRLLEIS